MPVCLEIVLVLGKEFHELERCIRQRDRAHRNNVDVGTMLEKNANDRRVQLGLVQSCCGIIGVEGMAGQEL